MLDDECLNENHPLHQYLCDLGLNEEPAREQPQSNVFSKNPNASSTLSEKFGGLIAPVSLLFSPAFYFARYIRLTILNALFSSALHSTEDNAVFQHFQQLRKAKLQNARSYSFLVLALHLGLLSLCYFSPSLSVWILSIFSLCFCVICLFVTLWMFVVSRLVYYIMRQTNLSQIHLRSCVNFLQDFELHNTFGTVGISSSRSSACLQQRVQLYLRSHVWKMIHVSLALKRFPLSGDLCSNLSIEQIQHLKDALQQVQSEDSTALNDCKMFREVNLLLESDLFNQLMGLFCFLSYGAFLHWWRLGLLLADWAYFLYRTQHSLWEVDQIRVALEQGTSGDSNIKKLGVNIDCHGEQQMAHRATHDLLMHLLVAVDKTREFKDAIKQKDENSSATFSPQLSHLRLQLQACENFLDELEKLLLAPPDVNHPLTGALKEPEELDNYSMLDRAVVNRVPVEAKDPEPEDDVLEDVAVGVDESDGDDKPKVDQDLDANLTPGTALHPSVLKELRVAIACRRLTMQEREKRALEKRLHTSPSSTVSTKEPEPTEQSIPSGHCDGRSPVSTDTMNLNDINQDSIATDSTLNDFFQDTATQEKDDLTKAQKLLRNQCSWRAQSAVSKRVHLFRQASGASHATTDEREPSKTNGFTVANGSTLPKTRYPTNPFVSSPSFAAALLARRRQAGYKEEEAFVEVGAGDETKLNRENDNPKKSSLGS